MIKLRLFGRPQWEPVRGIEGGRLERRLERGAVCGECGKKKAYRYRVVSHDGGTIVYMGGAWCCEGHMVKGNRIDRIKSTGD